MNCIKIRKHINKNRFLNKYNLSYFSTRNTSDKLSQFFKLPKHKLQLEDKVFDRPQSDYSVLQTLKESEVDKLDMMDKVIKRKKLESERNTQKFFNNLTPMETLKVTENLVEKLRLNREFKFTNEYKEKEIMNEYGNYDKYFANYKVITDRKYNDDDDGESVWEMKYNELQEKFKNPYTKDQVAGNNKHIESRISKDLNKYGAEYSFSDYLQMRRKEKLMKANGNISSTNPRMGDSGNFDYNSDEDSLKNPTSFAEIEATRNKLKGPTFKPTEEVYDIRNKFEKDKANKNKVFDKKKKELIQAGFDELRFNDDNDIRFNNPHQNEINGRVSPWCKEDIYRLYLEGWTVKDLSYKYGLLPERVKLIVYLRDLFWREIYPRIGESGLRRRMENGMEYAKRFAYIDYGKDLHLMAEREQGINVRKISRSELDCKPDKQTEKEVSKVLKNIKPKGIDHIPLNFFGKGSSGYLIKNMHCNRGKGSKRVGYMFKKFLNYKDTQANMLPYTMEMKRKVPPRIATLGFKG